MSEHEPQNSNDNSSNEYQPQPPSYFSSGTFVLALIVFAIFILIVSWTVSLTALFFGVVGTLCSIAACLLNNKDFKFSSKNTEINFFKDETLAYLAARSLLGMVSGTTAYVVVFTDPISSGHWASIAIVALFAGFIIDTLIFKRKG